jgi:hypothetical protein
MRTKSSGDKYEVRQNYLPLLNRRIFSALLEVCPRMERTQDASLVNNSLLPSVGRL